MFIVLIVAKCIVNSVSTIVPKTFPEVLIVAKCIVNEFLLVDTKTQNVVLIVAKCIVNAGVTYVYKNRK